MVDREAKKSFEGLKESQTLEDKLKETQEHLQEMRETLEAIVAGSVDGLIRRTPTGNQIFILKGAEDPYRSLIEKMSEGAVLLSDAGTILYCNSGFAKLVDAPLDSIMGKNIVDWVSDGSTETFEQLMLNIKGRSGKVFDIGFQTTKKLLVPTQVSTTKIPVGSGISSALIIVDLTKHMEEDVKRYTADLEKEITIRKKAEEALKESERKFKTLAENAPDPIMRFDPNRRIMYLNPANLAVTRSTLKDFLGKTNEEMGMPAELCKLWNNMFDKAKTTKHVQQAEFNFKSTTGLKAFDLSIVPEFDEDGSLVSFMGISRDVTERKHAEEALKTLNAELETRVQKRTKEVENERTRLFSVLDSLPAMICLLTPDHYVAFANRGFKERFGESQGRHCYDYCFGNKEPCSFCESYKALETGKPHRWEVKCPDGSFIDAYDFPFTDTDGNHLILEMDIDITEQKKMEKSLKDAERLAAIGATAGMVGHDIRNPLQSISGDIYLAMQELIDLPQTKKKQNLKENLEEINKSVEYINKIVQDLQDFARPIASTAQEVDLQTLCESVLFKNGLPDNIEGSCQVEEDARRQVTDPELLTRVLGNLVNNAVQAMPEGGKLYVHAFREANDTVITVEDTGCGIPEGVGPKLFTPLFTTKSKGQGFGLAVVKRVIEALGGTVTYKSEVGKGTKFILRLPPQKNKR